MEKENRFTVKLYESLLRFLPPMGGKFDPKVRNLFFFFSLSCYPPPPQCVYSRCINTEVDFLFIK